MKIVIRYLIVISTAFLLVEICFRLSNYSALQIPSITWEAQPKFCFVPHPTKGISLAPGKYQISLGPIHYTATHSNDSNRISSLEGDSVLSNLPIVAFYGCSFTYGTGVEDTSTYPYLLQSRLNEIIIINKAVPGYGQVQVLDELRRKTNHWDQANQIVLNFLPFHLERNTLNPLYQHKLNIGYQISKKNNSIAAGQINYPYAVLKNDSIEIKYRSLQDIASSLFLESELAAFHQFKSWIRNFKADKEHDLRITKAIIKDIQREAQQANIQFSMSFLQNDAISNNMIAYCDSLGIQTLKAFVNLSDTANTNYPYDMHPNAKAHRLIANKLISYFQ